MRIVIAVALLIAMALPLGAAASKPVLLVFSTTLEDGVDKALAASATNALCTYFRETHRVEALVFNRDSPTVLRAIMDKQLTADQVASYASQQERITVAKALSYDYAAGSEVTIRNSVIQVKVWLAKANGTKRDRWEAIQQASTGGTGDRGYDNAMQSATSQAVIGLAGKAFVDLARAEEKQPSAPSDTTAIGAEVIAPPVQPTAAELATQAEASAQAGNLALAIEQYQQAVNADPPNTSLRLRLADAYARKGLYDEANGELHRAATAGASSDQISEARANIEKMKSGEGAAQPVPVVAPPPAPKPDMATTPPAPKPDTVTPTLAPKPDTVTPKPDAVTTNTETRIDRVVTGGDAPRPEVRSDADPKAAIEKIREGDKLWKSSQPDEAADAYREAMKLNPSEWRAYERLALVDASLSLFSESRRTLEDLAKVQPNPPAQMLSNRYELFRHVFEQWFDKLFKQYDGDAADYAKQVITRQSYYGSTKSLGLRLESMAKFIDALPVPKDKQPVNLHLSLACGLVSQAASSLQDYLETNNADSRANAETFVAQAKKELQAVGGLAADK